MAAKINPGHCSFSGQLRNDTNMEKKRELQDFKASPNQLIN